MSTHDFGATPARLFVQPQGRAEGFDGSPAHLDGAEPPCRNVDNICAETDPDPLTAWPGIHAELLQEIAHKENDFPGTSADRTVFANIQYANASGSWVNKTYTVHSPTCFGQVERRSDTKFEAWTEPLDDNR